MSDFAIKAMSGFSPVTGERPNDQTFVARERQNGAAGGNVLPPTAAKQPATSQINTSDKDLSNLLENRSTKIRFQPSEIANRTLITVQDSASGEIVRQIPSKAVIAIAAYIEQYLAEVSPDSATESSMDDVE